MIVNRFAKIKLPSLILSKLNHADGKGANNTRTKNASSRLRSAVESAAGRATGWDRPRKLAAKRNSRRRQQVPGARPVRAEARAGEGRAARKRKRCMGECSCGSWEPSLQLRRVQTAAALKRSVSFASCTTIPSLVRSCAHGRSGRHLNCAPLTSILLARRPPTQQTVKSKYESGKGSPLSVKCHHSRS